MRGLMQNFPLHENSILDHAKKHHASREIISRSIEGPIHKTNYAQIHHRAKQCAQALVKLGIKPGQVVATMAWNTWRHLETWYGILGAGAVYHTLNPRLFPDQLHYIINHAEDQILFLDATFIPIMENLAEKLPSIRAYIIMADKTAMPKTKLKNALCYEDLLAAEDGDFQWILTDENDAAGICYTSGTTGNPKGVVYSHRSNVLHTLIAAMPDVLGPGNADSVMPVVPMFHANAWGLAFLAPMVGAKMVMPGAKMDGESIYELLDSEKVSFTAAVPTVWLMLLQYLEGGNRKLPHLKRVAIGGSAVPRSMIEKFDKDYGVTVSHLWGMTEMSPVGTTGSLRAHHGELDYEDQLDIRLKQGLAPYMVDMKITDDDGRELPWDGKSFGHLMVRGPAVARAYLKGEGGEIVDEESWFDTGDVATIDAEGYMQITDRSKDVIKSGGEWISSIEIENLAVGHPDVAEAAVIGLPHPKWDERPLLVLVPKEGAAPSARAIKDYLKDKIAKWWMPDDIVLTDEIPHTATGKIQKMALREKYQNHRWTDEAG